MARSASGADRRAPARARTPGDPASRPRARFGSACTRAVCAAPICTSPLVICRRSTPASSPVTRSSASSTRAATRANASPSATGSASRGSATRAGAAGGAGAEPRTSASRPRSPGGTPTAGTREYAVVDEAYAYALPDAYDDEHAAPLLCAGIVGYRALRAGRAAARRPPGHLRLRRVRAPRRAGRGDAGRDRARV